MPAREAKKITRRGRYFATDDYKEALLGQLARLIGKTEWQHLSERYEIDPLLIRINSERPDVSASDQSCLSIRKTIKLNGRGLHLSIS